MCSRVPSNTFRVKTCRNFFFLSLEKQSPEREINFLIRPKIEMSRNSLRNEWLPIKNFLPNPDSHDKVVYGLLISNAHFSVCSLTGPNPINDFLQHSYFSLEPVLRPRVTAPALLKFTSLRIA
jgi:hypothetical protein